MRGFPRNEQPISQYALQISPGTVGWQRVGVLSEVWEIHQRDRPSA